MPMLKVKVLIKFDKMYVLEISKISYLFLWVEKSNCFAQCSDSRNKNLSIDGISHTMLQPNQHQEEAEIMLAGWLSRAKKWLEIFAKKVEAKGKIGSAIASKIAWW